MLLQIQGFERDEHRDVMSQMFRQRKVVFYDNKQWDVNVVDGQFEIDEYDRDDTVYLVSVDRSGRVLGSIRLISTIMPHMMSGPFGKMFPDVSFKSPTIWEATRFAASGDQETLPNGVTTAASELLLGAVQFGLQNGVRHITGVYEAGMARIYRRCGLKNIELGRHQTQEHGAVCVGLWEITSELEASVIAATSVGRRDRLRPAPRAA